MAIAAAPGNPFAPYQAARKNSKGTRKNSKDKNAHTAAKYVVRRPVRADQAIGMGPLGLAFSPWDEHQCEHTDVGESRSLSSIDGKVYAELITPAGMRLPSEIRQGVLDVNAFAD
jgi:hypothetical protein